MFHFNISIDNPFHSTEFDQKDYVWFIKKLSKHKVVEVQASTVSIDELLSFEVDLSLAGYNLAGFHISLMLLWFFFDFNLYDTRHWDYENNCWEVYDDDGR